MLHLAEVANVRRSRICYCGKALVSDFCPDHGDSVRVDSYSVDALLHLTDRFGNPVPILKQLIKISLPENQFLRLFLRKKSFLNSHRLPAQIIYDIKLMSATSPSINDLFDDFLEQIEGELFFGQFEIKSFQVRSSGTRVHYLCQHNVLSSSLVRFQFNQVALRQLSRYIHWRLNHTRATQKDVIKSLRTTRRSVYSWDGLPLRITEVEWDDEKRLPSKVMVTDPEGEKNVSMLSTNLYQANEHFFLGTRTESEAFMGLENIAQRLVSFFIYYLDMQGVDANYRKIKHDKAFFIEFKGKAIKGNAQLLQQIGSSQNHQLLRNKELLEVLEPSRIRDSLLVVACSATKSSHEDMLAAILRYQGMAYIPLKMLLLEKSWPSNVDLWIVSAKYGLLQALQPIPHYDERLTEATLDERKRLIQKQLSNVEVSRYNHCMLNVPKLYNKICEPLEILLKSNDCQITNIPARMSERNDAMMQWLIENAAEDQRPPLD
ncbi:MAG: hypothetical protein ACXACI_10425 [Candidatus Hodarchaeales archaeon]